MCDHCIMRILLLGILSTVLALSVSAQSNVIIIPYQSAMHLSDADAEIAQNSDMDMGAIRQAFRDGLMKQLRAKLSPMYDVTILNSDFVGNDEDEGALLYRSVFFQQDSIWPLSHPQKDSLLAIKQVSYLQKKKKKPIEVKYMNVGFYDQGLIAEIGRKHDAQWFLFLNELDIRTDAQDCKDPAGNTCDREIRVHYSIFDRSGKQVHGDLAIAHTTTDVADVNQIVKACMPHIADYILASVPH